MAYLGEAMASHSVSETPLARYGATDKLALSPPPAPSDVRAASQPNVTSQPDAVPNKWRSEQSATPI